VTGYSGKPLGEKLGLRPGMSVAVVSAPDAYLEWLGPLPDETQISDVLQSSHDLVHVFVTDRSLLGSSIPLLKGSIVQNGSVWVSWPKKNSGVESDLDENVVRQIGLAAGMVDVKVAAVSHIWSGLKFVIRLKDRL
jgi:hypothetical protein